MQAAHEFTLVLVTAPNQTVARKIAATALSARLAACANLIPKVESHYWWNGQLESSSEVLILFKTTRERLPQLEESVLKNHTYDTPEFISLELKEGNEKYLKWIDESVRNPR